MKRLLVILSFFFISATSKAVNTFDLTLRYNTATSKYEVYAKPNFTGSFSLGSAQISVVTPASVSNASLTITSTNGGGWTDNSQVYAPSIDAAHDFHAVGTSGGVLTATSGTEILLFTFTLTEGCVPGLRVFNNATDPDSTKPGMGGGDFLNSFPNSSFVESYNANYSNTGSTCTVTPTCNLTAPVLSKN